MSNISRCIRYHALRTPDRTALTYAGNAVSYGEMWRRIMAIAGLLRAKDVQIGDRIALQMKNSPAFLEIAFAVSHVGAVLVPTNFRLSPAEIDHILQDSGAVLLFHDAEFENTASTLSHAVSVSNEAQADSSLLAPDGVVEMAPRSPGDLFRIMYTSGTTDRPKGVMHSYQNFYAKTADHLAALNLTADTRLLTVGPLYHVGAFDLPGIGVLWAGGRLAILRDFDADAALDLIARERLDAAWLAPVMTSGLLAAQARDPRDTSSLRCAIGGGERTPEARIRGFTEAFPNARYIDAYGLTESCSGDTLMEAGREIEKIGSVGRPVSQVDIEIRDDAGCALPAGIEGEVCLRGAKITGGYWNAPDKTAASFFGDWFRTGDIGYLDGEGFLFLTDRKKDMIISGGENIASSEVERVICELPQIQEVAVIGVADARWGERPIAFVVLQADTTLGEDEIKAHCRSRLAAFKAPDRILFEVALPRNASGKILKPELRARFA